jgi:predicted ATP-dependent protease
LIYHVPLFIRVCIAPAIEGRLLAEEDIGRLTPEEREKVLRVSGNLQREIEDRWRTIRQLERSARDDLHALDTETATQAAHHLIDDVRARYQGQPAVLQYLEALEADVIAHADDFRKGKEAETPPPPFASPPGASAERLFSRYEVNVLVDNKDLKGAPVVVETNPTYHNLIGRIEH